MMAMAIGVVVGVPGDMYAVSVIVVVDITTTVVLYGTYALIVYEPPAPVPDVVCSISVVVSVTVTMAVVGCHKVIVVSSTSSGTAFEIFCPCTTSEYPAAGNDNDKLPESPRRRISVHGTL